MSSDLGDVGAALILVGLVGAGTYAAVQALAPDQTLPAMVIYSVIGAGIVLIAFADDGDSPEDEFDV
jgi:hypothetical protein